MPLVQDNLFSWPNLETVSDNYAWVLELGLWYSSFCTLHNLCIIINHIIIHVLNITLKTTIIEIKFENIKLEGVTFILVKLD